MTRYRIPPEYADAVRAAWPSFWLGVASECIHFPHHSDPSECEVLFPDEVRAMLKPCQRCGGKNPQCFYCRDGRPLVELITDYDHEDYGPGTVTLGTVTADPEVVPVYTTAKPFAPFPCIMQYSDGDGLWRSRADEPEQITLVGPPDATHAIHLTGVTP